VSAVKPPTASATEPAIADPSNRQLATPSAPGATIEVRHVDAATGVIITVAGVVGRNDAAILSRQLHTVLDAAPAVVVVNLSQVLCVAVACRDVLATARDRAHAAGIALHVVDPGNCIANDRLAADRTWGAANSSHAGRKRSVVP
jgi:hypothetical protein